jgi:hypothetical protein
VRETMSNREQDVQMALARGWQGPAVWIEDEDGDDPYLFPPGAPAWAVTINDRDHDHLVPEYSDPTGYRCECHPDAPTRAAESEQP